MNAIPERRPHAALDLATRRAKGLKIERLLRLQPGAAPLRVLEVGTGAGGIAHHFGTHPQLACVVDAVDVRDNRRVVDGFRFQLVEDVALPFADASFDVVISNHVIEHVGDGDRQAAHLAELQRVLAPGGCGYLAMPNRWMLVEPHFKLPLLSWLPRGIADAYVRAAGRGTHYDCRPLGCAALERALAGAGFDFEQRHGEALRLTFEIERPRSPAYRLLLRPVPDVVWRALRRLFPTLIYVLRKR